LLAVPPLNFTISLIPIAQGTHGKEVVVTGVGIRKRLLAMGNLISNTLDLINHLEKL
jgi:hypothetical protein